MNFTHLLLALLSVALSCANPISNKASETHSPIDLSTFHLHASLSWNHHSTHALTNLTLPIASPPLPQPANTSHLLHIALGRGVQNYTCASLTNSSAAPVSAGALATLYNATALLAHSAGAAGQVLDASLVSYALSLPKPAYPAIGGSRKASETFTAMNLDVSGFHFFAPAPASASSNSTTVAGGAPIPHFDLTHINLGAGAAVKVASSNAPVRAGVSVFSSSSLSTNSNSSTSPSSATTSNSTSSSTSLNTSTYNPPATDVPWLYLSAANITTAGSGTGNGKGTEPTWKQVYRVKTQGGVAPATCKGLEGSEFGVEYAAEYWFYG